MVSKIEILAYYISFALDIYFIISLAFRVADVLSKPSPTDPAQTTAIVLDLMSFGFAIGLFLLDITTLQNYYLETTQRDREDPSDKSYAVAYIIDSKLELFALVVFVTVLSAVTFTDNSGADRTDAILNIAFGIVDYIVIALRSTVRLKAFSNEESFDVLRLQYWDNLFPFNLLYFVLFSACDIAKAVVLSPCTIRWSIKVLCTARWFPEFAGEGVFAPITSGLQAVT